jgi:hypothetical protein
MDHGPLAPIDRERVLPVLQQDIIAAAIEGHCRHAPLPATLCTLGAGTLGLPAGQACIQLGMSGRLTHPDKVETRVESQRTKRRCAGESIAPQSHWRRDQGGSRLRKPTFACGLRTVLCLLTILRHDVCGR